jgi:hypothetical protein
MSRVPPPKTDIGRFYQQVDDFKGKLINILQKLERYEEITDLEKYYDKLQIAKKANVRLPIELLYKHGIEAYARQILTRDEFFFLKEVDNFEHDSQTQQEYEIEQHDLLFIGQVKGIWNHLTDAVKNNIWNYVQVICMLAERVVKKNTLVAMRQQLAQEGLLK